MLAEKAKISRVFNSRHKWLWLLFLAYRHELINSSLLGILRKNKPQDNHAMLSCLASELGDQYTKLLKILANQLEIKYQDFNEIKKNYTERTDLVSKDFAQFYSLVVFEDQFKLYFVFSSLCLDFYDKICFFLSSQLPHKEHQLIFTQHFGLMKAIAEIYKFTASNQIQMTKASLESNSRNSLQKLVESDQQNIEAIYHWLLKTAISENISDIHIEAQNRQIGVIRIRQDGRLQDFRELSIETLIALTSRFKLLARLQVGEKRRVQEGKIEYPFEGKVCQFRISIIPTDWAEKTAIRYFDTSKITGRLTPLGLDGTQRDWVKELLRLKSGLILFTGSTGAGKSTTLYNVLTKMSRRNINICTLEDPIEFNLARVNQVEVQPHFNLSFVEGLKALLRQDPDLIMLGEIRDLESLQIAIQASLTGHLVLSTLHTNSAVETLLRLVDLGAEPYLLKAALKGIISQRLVGIICQHCQAKGCQYCHYKKTNGRTGVFEVLKVDKSIHPFITKPLRLDELSNHLKGQGFDFIEDQLHRLTVNGIYTNDL